MGINGFIANTRTAKSNTGMVFLDNTLPRNILVDYFEIENNILFLRIPAFLGLYYSIF